MTPIAVSGECLKAPFLPAVTPRAVSGENNAALFLRVRVLVVVLLCRARIPMVLVTPCLDMGMDPSVPLRLLWRARDGSLLAAIRRAVANLVLLR